MPNFDLELFYNKLVAILIITVLNTSFTLIPLFATSFRLYECFLDHFNSFAGGLVLGISVLEMLDSDRKEQNDLLSELAGTSFIVSFVATFFIHFYFTNLDKMKQTEALLSREQPTLYLRMDSFKHFSREFSRANTFSEERNDSTNVEMARMPDSDTNYTINGDNMIITSSSSSLSSSLQLHQVSSYRSLFAWCVAISTESFFSCIVLASQTRSRIVWVLFTAIVSGDWAESLILGQKIHDYFRYRSLFYQFFIVAIVQMINLFGFVIGILSNMLTPWVQEYVSAILFALLSGVFLYMSMIDMIMKELYTDVKLTRKRFSFKVILILAGIVCSIFVNICFIEE